jgi:hypothetical protein
MGLLRSVSLGLLFFAAFNQSALARNVALVIGNSAYEHVHGLTNPNADSAAVAKNLHAAGFDLVELRNDLAATDMRRVLREFADKVRDAEVAKHHGAKRSQLHQSDPKRTLSGTSPFSQSCSSASASYAATCA